MYNWKKWIWPGVITSVLLTAGTAFIKTEPIQGELSTGAVSELSSTHGWASIDISGRDVTLSGEAPSNKHVAEAKELASSVYGVRVVRDNSELIPIVKPYQLTIEKADGKVTVSGFAPNDVERANILEVAKKAGDGLEVVDDMDLARGSPENISELNAYAIGALSGLSSGEAKIIDKTISVKGVANQVADYEATLDYLKTTPSDMDVISQEITPATVSPYIFSASKADGKLSLNGFVPSSESRNNLGEKFQAANPGTSLENNLEIALGAPDGMDWDAKIGKLSGVLGMLEAGSASVNNENVSYSGNLPEGSSLDVFNTTIGGAGFDGLNIASNTVVAPAAPVVVEESSAPEIPTVDPYLWSVSKRDGKVTVNGNVTSDEERASVLGAMKSTFAGSEIDDQQILGLGKPGGFDAARTAIVKGLKFLDEGQGTVSGTATNLVGVAKNNNIKELAGKIVQKGLPEGYSVNLDLSSPESTAIKAGEVEYVEAPVIPTADPYLWGLSKSGDGKITVTGNVTSDEERASVLNAMSSAFAGSEIDDQQTLALGKPDGLDEARLGLSKGMKFLETGAARIAGDNITVSGAAKNNNIKKLATNVFVKGVPYAYKLDVAIRAPETNAITAGDVKFVEAPVIPTADPYFWGIAKEEGKITVVGNVTSDDERTSVINAATAVFAGSEIDDQQTVALGKPDDLDSVRSAVSKGIKFLETGAATVRGNDVNVFGKAKNNNIKGLATRLITKAVPSSYNLNVDISSPESTAVTAGDVKFVEAPVIPTADPYLWGLIKNEGNVVVTGNVSSEDERASVVDGVKNAFAGSSVNDQQTLAFGKPDGFDQARTGLAKGLKFLDSGAARIVGDAISVSGVAKNNNVKKLATNVIVRNVPYAYKLDISIRAPESTAVTAGNVEFVAKAPEPAPTASNACAAEIGALIDGKVIQFETNSSEFLPESEALVNLLASKLEACPEISISAEGHTDSRGSNSYNQALSNDRAHKIKKFLIKAGIKPSRIKAKGFGETKPIDTNQTPEGRAKNRRTLISIIK